MADTEAAGKKGRQVIILLLILLVPSILYLILQTGTNHYESLPYFGPREVNPTPEDGRGDTLYYTIPDFSFTDQKGNNVSREDLIDKVTVVDFFFTRCPTICPKMATHLLALQTEFSKKQNFQILSFTVDPRHDTTEVLQQYGEKVHAKYPVWRFATGDKDELYKLGEKGFYVNAMEDEAAPGGVLHSGMFILVDGGGHIRGYFDGTSTSEVKDLVDAIAALSLEPFVSLKEKKK